MNWLSEQYQNERRADDLRAARHEAEIEALLSDKKPKGKPKQVRRALGSKLIELGERLQDTQSSPNPSTSKI